MRVNNPVTQQEISLKDDDFLISRTDLTGKITYANPGFVKISGFSRNELIGENHNLVRHPDMPVGAFADLWSTVQSGKSWNGIVKNRTKNGSFYWVKANVTPCYQAGQHVGFTSVRVKASAQEIAFAEKVYQSFRNDSHPEYILKNGVITSATFAAKALSFFPTGISAKLLLLTGIPAALLSASAVMSFVGAGITDEGTRSLIANAQIALAVISILSMTGLRGLVTKSITKPIEDCITFSSQIAAGNLSATIAASDTKELQPLVQMLDTIKKSMRSICDDISHNIDQFALSASEISSGNVNLSSRTEEQAAALQETAASMEEITSTVQMNSGNAKHASQMSQEASRIVSSSGEIMSDVVERMNEIISSSKKMSQHIDSINNIAFQTNILALNASVEAARAGEQGRGFAVVADEVRQLASKSANAAKEISSLIGESSRQITLGEQLVKKAQQSIDDAVNAVTKVNDIIGEISAASSEQSIGIGQVNEALAQMESVTNHNSSLVQQVSSISVNLESQVRDVDNSISVFMKDPQKHSKATPANPTSSKPPRSPVSSRPAPAKAREVKQSFVLPPSGKPQAQPAPDAASGEWTTF